MKNIATDIDTTVIDTSHQCLDCGKAFHSDASRRRHEALAHRRVKVHCCSFCNKRVNSSADLQGHISVRHTAAKLFKCDQCPSEFSYKKTLVLHIREKHTSEEIPYKKFVCHLCKKIVKSKLDLKGHLAHNHGWAKEFMCNVCGREFGYKQGLVFHIRSSHPDVGPEKRSNAEKLVLRRHVCHLCSKIVSKKNLRGHMAYMHGATKEFKCEVCGMEFSYKNVMNLHMKTKHEGIKRKRSESAANGKFICQLCGKNVTSKTNLQGHMSNEHGIAKEFGCNVCGKEFAYKRTMKDHVRVKHPEKN